MKVNVLNRREIQGFTLIELMVALVVLVILTLTATPALSAALENQKLKQAAIDLKIGLQEARSRAVLARTETVLCPNKGVGVFAADIDLQTCAGHLTQFEQLAPSLISNSVALVEIDEDLNLQAGSSSYVRFSPQGYTAEQHITLCGKQRSYTITVYIPGNVAVFEGGACV